MSVKLEYQEIDINTYKGAADSIVVAPKGQPEHGLVMLSWDELQMLSAQFNDPAYYTYKEIK